MRQAAMARVSRGPRAASTAHVCALLLLYTCHIMTAAASPTLPKEHHEKPSVEPSVSQKSEQLDKDWEARAMKDKCELHSKPCSPFFGSPCDKYRPVPSSNYFGECNQTVKEAEKRWRSCGNGSDCFCHGHAVSCCGGLKAIPDLTVHNVHSVLYLDFTYNNLTVLDEIVLKNLSRLKWLILNRNPISKIHEGAFTKLPDLERLELAYNRVDSGLDGVNFTRAVNTRQKLQVLDINATRFAAPGTLSRRCGLTWVIRRLNLRFLRQLFVADGCLKVFYLSDVHQLHSLCKLSLKSNFIKRLPCCSIKSNVSDSAAGLGDQDGEEDEEEEDTPQSCVSKKSRGRDFCNDFSLPHLAMLDLANNSLIRVPWMCRGQQEGVAGKGRQRAGIRTVVPALTDLSLSINAIINPKHQHFSCLNSLFSLALTGNPLKKIEANIFREMPNLHDVDLRFTNVMRVKPYAFNHSTLREFTISNGNWFMDQDHDTCCIRPNLFKGTNLTTVDLANNNFRRAKDSTIAHIFRPLATVNTLLIANIGITNIPHIIQHQFRHLQVLDIGYNMLSKLPKKAFDKMRHLKYLSLEKNYLADPDVEVLRKLIKRGVHINLEGNPFSCTCDMLAFLNLYKAHSAHTHPWHHNIGGFVGMPEKYTCNAPRALWNVSLIDVQLTVQNCLLTVTQEILIYVVCLLAILSLLLYSLFYKYRWQVRFWLYTMHMRLSRGRPRGGNPSYQRVGYSRFTAFVSYCKEDSHFVLTKVLPVLERNRRLPLCIHERDFIPGKYISQNVVECMEESRHVLLILSNAFLQNEWCRFELFVAQKYGLVYRQIPVTTLLLEPLRLDLLDAHVVTMLQAAPGIEWPGEESNPCALANFWSRLDETLGAKSGRQPRRP